jgi:hypothetical protein
MRGLNCNARPSAVIYSIGDAWSFVALANDGFAA